MNHDHLVKTKHPVPFNLLGWALTLAISIAGVCTAQTTPRDLTAPGVIENLDRSDTFNLGPTGLRGWIHVHTDGFEFAASGRISDASRQILVTTASAPGNAVLAVDDVILGVIAANSGTVPSFTSDARKAFGAAITDAEKASGARSASNAGGQAPPPRSTSPFPHSANTRQPLPTTVRSPHKSLPIPETKWSANSSPIRAT